MLEQIGRYKILRELGRGAMGVVYAATDPLIGRQVAIKTIRLGNLDAGADREELTRRLQREAQSAGILSHPGIITVYDVGEQGDDAYIVMEMVDGKSLEAILTGSGPHHSATLFSVLRNAAAALDYAHSKGIVHRDVKPANIMICADGSAKIADFGVAKISASHSMTQSGFVLGTPSYMSPEQAQGRTIDGRSDQFSLAVVAYRMLAGKLPFEGATLTALLTKILWEEPGYEQANVSGPLLLVFKKALAKDPALRFGSCSEFIKELETAHDQQNAHVRERLVGLARAEVGPEKGKSAQADTQESAKAEEPPRSAHAELSAALPHAEAASAAPAAPAAPAEVPVEDAAVKSKRWIWPAAAAVFLLAALGFWTVQNLRKSESSLEAPAAAEVPSPEPAKPAAKPVEPAPIEPPPVQEPVAQSAESAPKAAAATGVPKRKRAAVPLTGTIEWSGNLPKNAVLVIDGAKASIGTVIGELPGKPVKLDIEPEGIVIRQMPGAENGWKQVMLVSGDHKRSSITIRWQIE